MDRLLEGREQRDIRTDDAWFVEGVKISASLPAIFFPRLNITTRSKVERYLGIHIIVVICTILFGRPSRIPFCPPLPPPRRASRR
jgi:hypothetical protein